jgi:hypothetical protein
MDPDMPEDLKENIHICHAVYIPLQLVHMFLERRLTTWQVLVSVHSVLMLVDTSTATYKPLLDWLRVPPSEEGHGAIERANSLAAPIIDAALQGRLAPLEGQD